MFTQITAPFLLLLIILSCNNNTSNQSKDAISELHLKRGDVISCGPPGTQFGTVDFDMTCDTAAKKDFNLAVELLHSFEYDEAEKVFAKVINETPDCAMAYWGVAMCNFHPLWNPPTEEELQKGEKAIDIANGINAKSAREAGYINAIELFCAVYEGRKKKDRCAFLPWRRS